MFVLIILVRVRVKSVFNNGICMVNTTFDLTEIPGYGEVRIIQVCMNQSQLYRTAYAQALQRMLEEHAYFGVLYGLWHKDELELS